MNILVLNCGSSSLKFQVISMDAENAAQGEEELARGMVERIGGHALVAVEAGEQTFKEGVALRDHTSALEYVLRSLLLQKLNHPSLQSLKDIHAVGHRVVHGAERFAASVCIDDAVLRGIEDAIELAPLHNDANLKGIKAIFEIFGRNMPSVAVFDTAFHTSMPEVNYLYAIPYQLYRRHRIRRYGFHGTSHRYVAERYAKLQGLSQDKVNLISLHLGNGASACLIKAGRSQNTSMGFTPLAGLMMGTRSGDIDPAITEYLAHKEGLSLAEVESLLNKQSGLLGISGLTHDMRDLLDEERHHSDRRVQLAIAMFCQRVKHYLGAYLAEANGVDALVFTGGIGENAATIRQRICANLSFFGIELAAAANTNTVGGAEGLISLPGKSLAVWVIPTNEELMIARDTASCIAASLCP